MGRVQRVVIAALIRAIERGAPFVAEADLEAIARSSGGSGASVEHAVARLVRRGLLSSQWEGTRRIGYCPTAKAYSELGPSGPAEPGAAADRGRPIGPLE